MPRKTKATGRATADTSGRTHITSVGIANNPDGSGTALMAHCSCGRFTLPVSSPAHGHQAVDNHLTDVTTRTPDYQQETLL